MADHVFERDDDVVFARYFTSKLSTSQRPLIFSDGSYWAYSADSGSWLQFPHVDVKRAVMSLSGMELFVSKGKETDEHGVEKEVVKTKKINVVNARLKGVMALVEDMVNEKDYFIGAEHGIAFTNGFVTVTPQKGIVLGQNMPERRCRIAMDFAFRRAYGATDSDAPKWAAFLKDVLRDDADAEDKRNFLQEFIGISLVGGAVHFEKAALLVGDGSNGKSVFLDVVSSIFPSRNVSSIAPQQLDNEYYRARLDGVMLNVVSELPKRDIVDSPALNGIISGDQVPARRIREEPFDMRARAGHIYAVNPPLPTVGDLSGGFWRRFVVLTFNRDYKSDPYAREKEAFVAELKAERRGIVRWALEGAERLKKRGKYVIPPSSTEYLRQWREESDQVALFVRQRLTRTDDTKAMFSDEDLYALYRKWGEATGHRNALSLARFVQRVQLLGHKPIDVVAGITLRGLRPTGGGVAPSRDWALSAVKAVQSPLALEEPDYREDAEPDGR